MVLDTQLSFDREINDNIDNNNIVNRVTPSPTVIPPPINPIRCSYCHQTFDNELEFFEHKSQFARYAISRFMKLNQSERLQLPTFIEPPTPQNSQRNLLHNIGSPPFTHSLLFAIIGRDSHKNCFCNPYMRSIPEVPIFPPPHQHENNINKSFERTMDLLSLIDKPIDLFGIGNTNDNNEDIDLNLKL